MKRIKNERQKKKSTTTITKPNNLSDWRSVPNLMGLIFLAETNFLLCQRIYNKITASQSHRIKGEGFLLLAANNAFFAAVEILHTLISSTKTYEIRIAPLLEEHIAANVGLAIKVDRHKADKFKDAVARNYPNVDIATYSFLTYGDERLIGDIVKDIKVEITRSSGLQNLQQMKAKFEGFEFHKIRHQVIAHKIKALMSPDGAARLYIRGELMDNLAAVIKDLKINSYFWFGYTLDNPHNHILDSLEDLA